MKKIFWLGIVLILCFDTSMAAHADEQWQEMRTLHFQVFYDQAPTDFIKNVEDMAERCYDEISRDLGFRVAAETIFSNPIKIYIYNNLRHFREKTNQNKHIHGVAYFKKRTIRTFPSAHGFFDSTLPHELGHIIFREFIGYDKSIPLWLDEGVAMYQEKAKRWGAHETVKRAIKEQQFIPLKALSRKKMRDLKNQKELSLFYSHAASIVYFMIKELGSYRFLNLCKNIKNGLSFDMALEKSYRQFKGLDDLQKAWVAYLEGNE